ncbi:DNA mismatch repair protein MSH6 [Syzygium oleosum]|uniref:DNA mismatch repair protein MSH6 n=1 Tax=Syzygium oleosum TaxID=219896 RepID=UPI0024BACEA9|nr:DNA mismatch repair protein MSH6 [Syzygium oleosum]
MAPSRRQSNIRSPLVNKQFQITSFFSSRPASSSAAPSPLPNPDSTPRPNPSLREPSDPDGSPSPSPSPATPSPVQFKPRKKTPLVIPSAAAAAAAAPEPFGREVLRRRIRVYWPLDGAWYEGCVKSFDEGSGKHLVQYDDAEEELLDLGKERIEWIEESAKKFKRLRRGGSAVVPEKVVEDVESDEGGKDWEDDSSDEDWGKSAEKEAVEDAEDEDMEAEFVDEEDADEKSTGKSHTRKRKVGEGSKSGSVKKNKTGGGVCNEGSKVSVVVTENKFNACSTTAQKTTNGLGSSLPTDASERFSIREAEKLCFLGPERRDAKRRRPGDMDFDPRTLYLPPDFLKSLSGGQRQWWEFKSKHMDKVLFFKMGKFYELFEMDAHVGAKELDLQYMKGEQPHCGFPEKNFSMNVEKLARKGYRVLVAEQTETPEQLELRRKEQGSKDKVVKREICAVITKGTLTDGEMLSANPEASYLMAVTESCQMLADQKAERTLGVCLVDAATSRITLGQFKDDSECSALCCLLSEVRPVEIVKPTKGLSAETERVLLTHTRNPLVNELVPVLEFWDADKTVHELRTIYKSINGRSSSASSDETDTETAASHFKNDGLHNLPEFLSELVNSGENHNLALSALGGAIYYLKQAFLDETLLKFANFESLSCSGFGDVAQKHMILDAAALENLEVYENGRNGGSSGTLFAQLDHCVTAFGKRLLKTWLARPLYHLEGIKERQDAIADLKGENQPFTLDFRKVLLRLPDMERLLARVFSSSEACGRNANKVILYEDAAKKQLQEFISVLRGCELLVEAFSSLGVILENVESRQLVHLLTPGKGLPEVSSILRHFKDAFDWVEASNSGRIIPREGVDIEYDSACNKIKKIESNLMKHLKEQRKLLGETSITYVTVGKEAYLLEVPESLRGKVPRDYELRSSKKGFFRYWTPKIKKLVSELSQAESEKESALKSILHRLIRRFCEHQDKWRQLISSTAEIDVLISLAIASDYYEGPACRPVFKVSSDSSKEPCLSAKCLGHPILRSDSLGKGTFVPNDVNIGGSANASFILLTGPNMGGKSTLLRQVCLAVILAQIGADVPAESFQLSPVDRIFVRMGAKDHIMAGQSTFLTELSETASMLSSATRYSLVALDELGRGTSTSDGQAIAESVLDHFVHKVHCLGMFSTHYHHLAVNYRNDPGVSLCHMACQVGDGADGIQEVTFLYRLTPGPCPKSYGVNVARLAGLPECILQKAASRSRKFEHSYGRHTKGSPQQSCTQYSENEMVLFMQKLMKLVARSVDSESSDTKFIDSLVKLQHESKLLIRQR